MLRIFSRLKTNSYQREKNKKERIRKQVEKEDFLLSQIDEFREKAKQLQNLVSSKEGKVKELQNLVDEREGKAQRLQSILNERRQEADKINEGVQAQIEDLIVKVQEKIDDLSSSVEEKVAESVDQSKSVNDQVVATCEELKKQLEATKSELGEMMHEEDVKCYRNIQTLFDEFGEKMDKVEGLDKNIGVVKSYAKCLAWFSIVNFIVLVGFILYELGVFY